MRKLLVCVLIVIGTVTAIATATVLRAGNEEEHPADQALAPGVTTSTLSEKEMKSALGDDAFTVTSQFGRLTETPAKVDPAVCDGISGIVSPSTFAGVDWAAIRGSMGTSPQGQQFHFGSQAIIALTTPDGARRYLENSAQSWQQCNGHPYSNDSGGTIGHWFMKSFNRTGDTLTATVSQENSRYMCQRVQTIETKYVIDTEACGYDITNQGQALADRVLDNLKENIKAS